MKTYYLIQLAFWFHQLLVLNLEKRRRDHYAMMLHHLVTLSLLSTSYVANFVRVGNAILVTMDPADMFLPAAKILNYLDYRLTCDIMFGMFAISWVLTRHILFGYITYSTAVNTWGIAGWNPETGNYLSVNAIYMFLGLLVFLQFILIYWFSLIVKIAWKLISGTAPAHDTRSSGSE
jgi:acyl-CoA-dependent ceramide synthase